MMAPEHRYFGVGDYCDVCHAFFCRLIVPGRAGLSPSDARGIAQWGALEMLLKREALENKWSIRPIY